jgi:hypothetical protein
MSIVCEEEAPMRRFSVAAVTLAAVSALSIAPSAAGARALKDCGKLTVVSGFGGGLPKGVPVGSKPQLDGYRVSGSLSCKSVVRVLDAFEANASDASKLSEPPQPGWSPCNFISGAGYACRKGNNVILVALVWLKGGKRVGPKPHAPTPGQVRPTSTTVRCDFVVASATDTCTATVQDTGSGTRATPTGFVSWTSTGGGSFTTGSSCSLAQAQVNGKPTVGTASCAAQFKPPATTSTTVTATYIGGPKHLGSQASSNALVAGNVH